MSTTERAPGLDGDLTETLLRTRHFLQRTQVSDDLRTLHEIGGRRDR